MNYCLNNNSMLFMFLTVKVLSYTMWKSNMQTCSYPVFASCRWLQHRQQQSRQLHREQVMISNSKPNSFCNNYYPTKSSPHCHLICRAGSALCYLIHVTTVKQEISCSKNNKSPLPLHVTTYSPFHKLTS